MKEILKDSVEAMALGRLVTIQSVYVIKVLNLYRQKVAYRVRTLTSKPILQMRNAFIALQTVSVLLITLVAGVR